MSHIQQLIDTLCPNGVQYKKIKEVYTRIKGTPITASKMKEIESPEGEIYIIAGGKTVINAKEKDIPNANITRVPAVLIQSRGVIDVQYIDKPFTFKNEMWAYTTNNKTTLKFLYYVLKNNIQYFRERASGMGSLPQISLQITEDYVMPIPPLPIQEEIVRILDSFTGLTAELTAELTARKIQYTFYRDKLLSFDGLSDKEKEKVGLRSVTLKEVCSDFIVPMRDKPKSFDGKIPWCRIEDVEGTKINTSLSGQFVSEDTVDKMNLRIFPTGTVICTCSASLGTYVINTQPLITNQTFIGIVCGNEIINEYLRYVMETKTHELIQLSTEGTIPYISRKKFEELTIALPNIEHQQNIVNKLNMFSNMCISIIDGLPAEINARQKQYEYYRDKLLTFQELKA